MRSIPLAQFGIIERRAHEDVYRNGLGLRYGRMMQAISGVHFNYSFPLPPVGGAGIGQPVEPAAAGFHLRELFRAAAQLPPLRLARPVSVRHLAGGVEELLRGRDITLPSLDATRCTSRSRRRCA
jgi:hypothetical protein